MVLNSICFVTTTGNHADDVSCPREYLLTTTIYIQIYGMRTNAVEFIVKGNKNRKKDDVAFRIDNVLHKFYHLCNHPFVYLVNVSHLELNKNFKEG